MSTLWLSDAEVEDATRRKQPAAQARVLRGWGVPFDRRPDGTLHVMRSAFEARKPVGRMPQAPNGLNWSRA